MASDIRSVHADEYRQAMGLVHDCEESTLIAHWRLGVLFTAYGDSTRAIAYAIDKSQSFVVKHMVVANKIGGTEEELITYCADRKVETFDALYALVSGAKRDPKRDEPGGIQIQVPASIIKGLADAGCNPREVMELFWLNVSPHLLIQVAFADQKASAS